MGRNQARYGSGSGKGTRQPDEFAKRSDDSAAVHVKGRGQKTLTPKAHIHSKQTLGMEQLTHVGRRRQNPMMGATRIHKSDEVSKKSVIGAFSAGRDANSQTGRLVHAAGIKLPGRLAFKFGQHSNAITGTALAAGAAEMARDEHKKRRVAKGWQQSALEESFRAKDKPDLAARAAVVTRKAALRRQSIGKGAFEIPLSQTSRGGAEGVKALKATGREVETAVWNKAKPMSKRPVSKAIPSSFLEAGRALMSGAAAGRGAASEVPGMAGKMGGAKQALFKTGKIAGANPIKTAAATGLVGTAGGAAVTKRDSKRDGHGRLVSAGGGLLATPGGAMLGGGGGALTSALIDRGDGVSRSHLSSYMRAMDRAEGAGRAGAVAGTVGGGILGYKLTRGKKRQMSKRDRYYDPETNRQNRQGTYQGAGAVAGAYGVGSGIRGIHRDNKVAGFKFDTEAMGIRQKIKAKDSPNVGQYGSHAVALNERERAEFERLTGRKGKLVRGKQAGKIGLGAAALGTAAAFRQHSLSERNRAYN